MIKRRIRIALYIFIVILLGLLSRELSAIPLFVGDVLWGSMVFLLFKFLSPDTKVINTAVASVIFIFSIEFSQLYQAHWINDIRSTIIGHLVLGIGFQWLDLLYYLVGIIIIAIMTPKRPEK